MSGSSIDPFPLWVSLFDSGFTPDAHIASGCFPSCCLPYTDGATSFYTLKIVRVMLRRLGLVSFSRQVYLFQVTGTKYLTKETHRRAYFCSQLEGPILLVETLQPRECKAAAHTHSSKGAGSRECWYSVCCVFLFFNF